MRPNEFNININLLKFKSLTTKSKQGTPPTTVVGVQAMDQVEMFLSVRTGPVTVEETTEITPRPPPRLRTLLNIKILKNIKNIKNLNSKKKKEY